MRLLLLLLAMELTAVWHSVAVAEIPIYPQGKAATDATEKDGDKDREKDPATEEPECE